MKLKITKKPIFTLNQTLTKEDFNEFLEVKLSWNIFILFPKYNLCYRHNCKLEEIRFEYKPNVGNHLQALYHIQKIGPGLKFEHLCYAKLTFFQHLKLTCFNRIRALWNNPHSALAVLTIVLIALTYMHHLDFDKMIDIFNKFKTNPPKG